MIRTFCSQIFKGGFGSAMRFVFSFLLNEIVVTSSSLILGRCHPFYFWFEESWR